MMTWQQYGEAAYSMIRNTPSLAVQVAPKIMTWQQYGEAAYSMIRKRLTGVEGVPYKPDFTRCVDHFAIHAGKQP